MTDITKFERLEDRQLLAVSVTFGAKKGILTLTGDDAGDDVEIEGTGNSSEVDVFVNGGFVGTFAGVRSIRGNLGAGDDNLFLSAVHIGGSLDINMGSGADLFDFDDAPISNGSGEVLIGGNVTVNMGGNSGDFVEWDNVSGFGIVVGNNVVLAGVADVDLDGDGGDETVQASDIHIGGALKISLSGFGDVGGNSADVFLDDVNVLVGTVITGSSSADVIRAEQSSFGRRVTVNLGDGDDLVDIDQIGHNRFNDRVIVNFGGGVDTLDDDASNEFLVAPVLKGGPEVLI
jgi:hypothetical protein